MWGIAKLSWPKFFWISRYVHKSSGLSESNAENVPSGTGMKGRYVKIEDTIAGFKALCAGDYDHLPEQAFLYVGAIEEAVENAEKMKAEG